MTDAEWKKINDTFNRLAEETPDPNEKGQAPMYSPDDEVYGKRIDERMDDRE